MGEPTARRTVQVRNSRGLHMRPWEQFATLASQFKAKIEVTNGSTRADGTSIINLMTLAASEGTSLVLEAVGPDAEEAVRVLAEFVENISEEDETSDSGPSR